LLVVILNKIILVRDKYVIKYKLEYLIDRDDDNDKKINNNFIDN
jgi:hypothetical protein